MRRVGAKSGAAIAPIRPPQLFASRSTLEAMRDGQKHLQRFHGEAQARRAERGGKRARRRAVAGAQPGGQQEAQGHVGRDVDRDVLERDVARPRRGQEMQDLGGRHAPSAERLQARVDDDQQVGEREYPREADAVGGEPGARRVGKRIAPARRGEALIGSQPAAVLAISAVSTMRVG